MEELNLVCDCCGYDEAYGEKRFVGIFAPGAPLSTTDGEACLICGCPSCHTVKFITNKAYIQKRKDEYKESKMKG
jgi:hypothetical protein